MPEINTQITPPRIVVIGSANADLVARAQRLPAPGETVTGSHFRMIPGGKSANQAVAAARLGAETFFVGRIGADVFGDTLVASFTHAGVQMEFLTRDTAEPTGTALIGVSETTGENYIIVVPGANGKLSKDDIDEAAELIASADAILLCLEVPMPAVIAALTIARAAGVPTILNPAPAVVLPQSILEKCSILTPNEHEVGILAGISDGTPAQCAWELVKRGVETVIVTLGADGALAVEKNGAVVDVGAPMVERVVDTTAAGDCYTAGLAVALCEGKKLEHAMKFAATAASISVTRAGAQSSLPTREEVDELLAKLHQASH
jgi:ribokinase